MANKKYSCTRELYVYRDIASGRCKTEYTFRAHNEDGQEVAKFTWDIPVPPDDFPESYFRDQCQDNKSEVNKRECLFCTKKSDVF